MTDIPLSDDPRPVIAEIRKHGKSIYYLAKVMRLHVTQVQRIEKAGRCQPHQLTLLREILEYVSRETSDHSAQSEDQSQNVISDET